MTTTHCLCTLPPQQTPYTCLCLYAISNVPKCNTCSAPCTSFEPDCCETNPYLRALHVVDIALGSCSPLVCAPYIYNELTQLQLKTTPLSCVSVIDGQTTTDCCTTTTLTSDDCTGESYYEHAVEQQTTLVYVISQQAQQQSLPVFNKTSLYSSALHQHTLQWLCKSLHSNDISFLRTLYHVYQNVNTILKQLNIVKDISNMDKNAIQFAQHRQSSNVNQWEKQYANKTQHQQQHEESFFTYELEQQLETGKDELTQLNETLRACQQHHHHIQELYSKYIAIQRELQTLLQALCSTYSEHWKHISCNQHVYESFKQVVVSNCSVPQVLQKIHTSLEDISSYIQNIEQQSLYSWESATTGVVSKTSPALDAHVLKLATLQMSMESHQNMRKNISSFLAQYFCDDDGTVHSTYLEHVWRQPCQSLHIQLAQLRNTIALCEAI